MSQMSAATESVPVSISSHESNAASSAPAGPPTSSPAPPLKLRSCVVCRSRRVRCDKQSPCSNCRRAGIACVFPSPDRPLRWPRRFLNNNPTTSNVPASQDAGPDMDKVVDRIRNLESLVKELRGQLEEAHAAARSAGSSSYGVDPSESVSQDRDANHHGDTSLITNSSSVQKQFGRLVLQDASRSHYVSTGFWSEVNDELDMLKTDIRSLAENEYDSSEDEALRAKTSSTKELERAPSERHAFLFRHNLSPSAPDVREFYPLPSQIPFLVDIFAENVNIFIQAVHIPTVKKMIRSLRGSNLTRLTPANEALMFSICYAAINSMEEDDMMANFGSSKSDLNLKYRLGLEYALAEADFLNVPDVVLVQAMTIFLFLVRRHDSPRFVWMLTGLTIRMAQYLGLQRDGAQFKHLTPFEIETRRKAWWAVVALDMRTSEDQGTDLTIAKGSFDTKTPLNINDADIAPETKRMPAERDGITDMSFARIYAEVCSIMRQMMFQDMRDGMRGLEDQSRMLNEIYQKFEQGYFQHTKESENIAYWVTITMARMVKAKMTLIVFLPVLFSSPSEYFTDEIRTKLLVSAIEVAEYNHALNAEQACQQWRWLYQTCTHWHCIIYLVIEIPHRHWSPLIERAWVALHSSWLIPAQTPSDMDLRIWVPLRQMLAKVRKHRGAELTRLRADPQAANRLEMEDEKLPLPSSNGPFPAGSSVDIFRERWRQLLDLPGDHTATSGISGTDIAVPSNSIRTTSTSQPNSGSFSTGGPGSLSSSMTFEPTYLGTTGQQSNQILESTNIRDEGPMNMTNAPGELAFEQTVEPSYNPFPTVPADWLGYGFVPWLWADTDPSIDAFTNLDTDPIDVNMDFDGEVNWYDLIDSALGIERDTGPTSNSTT
ncbi:hypothetical protein NA57DRAFT_72750 [Rhizodiscina lignyota]|uniref:Zn(2)-C6 fungal-type domain-containing protein n=1 Tax=Rhizodiscina lignyota TaxID=1504668 RepID=A0A9P4IHT2_9PEZI|nr:hypothetical protein NA57DRAFT_72750 [Rhizodiscina lignyota]